METKSTASADPNLGMHAWLLQRLPRLIGHARAKELIFTGKRVKAAEALEIGLVDHLTPEGQAYDRWAEEGMLGALNPAS